MNEVELAETLQDHRGRIGSLEHRMDNVEKLTESVNNLAITTSNLVTEVRHTNDSVKEIKEQMNEAAGKPGARLEQIKTAIISALATAIIAGIIAVLF